MKEKRTMFFCSVLMLLFLITGCFNLSANDKLATEADNSAIQKDQYENNQQVNIIDDNSAKILTFHVIGRGLAPETATSKGQAILLGESAARANGYLKLVEKINGVYIDSYQRIGNGSVNYDIMHMETRAWLRGAEVMDVKEVNDGIFEAYMRVRIKVKKGHPLYHLSTI